MTGCAVVQVVSAYRQPAAGAVVQYPTIGGASHRTRPYALPAPPQPYYVSPSGHSSAIHGYSTQQHHRPGAAVNDQIAYQLRAPAAGVQLPAGRGTGDQYAWKIAGFRECSQSCGGGLFAHLSVQFSRRISVGPFLQQSCHERAC